MGDQSPTTPEPAGNLVQMPKEYTFWSLKLLQLRLAYSSPLESSTHEGSAQYPIIQASAAPGPRSTTNVLAALTSLMEFMPQEEEFRANLERAITLLTQRNELLVVVNSDPDVEFFELQSKADSMQASLKRNIDRHPRRQEEK
ncbi:unnamed protein product [Cylicostephanus goldi]|uniref:Uncharacterized protein n=1 Tax=Cylicostephanus goldi TaxID=71465 RepID=A0A3P7PV25_CYLGO|nr:unnamed protein product [Cylicostephanus goldi]